MEGKQVVSVHTMRAYGGEEVRVHSFLTLALDVEKWSASHLIRNHPLMTK